MSQTNQKERKNRTQYTTNLALAVVASQVGCVTILIVALTLIAGLWLDNRFDTSPIFLATLLIVSGPITVIIMLWIVRSTTSRIKPVEPKKDISQEEANRGTNA